MEDLLYKALMTGRNKKVAGEEYLVASGLKEAASFSVCEKEICLENVFKDTTCILHIKPENAGYLEILANCIEGFVQFDSRLVSVSTCEPVEVPFKIIAGKLHNGKNFAEISLRTPYQEVKIPVTADNRIKIKSPGESVRALSARLTEDYLALRTGKITALSWQENVVSCLENVSGNSYTECFFMLFKAQAYITAGKTEEAANITDYIRNLIKTGDENAQSRELYAYTLYLECLYKKDDGLTKEALVQIEKFYEDEPSWRLLWMLFYIDESSSEPEKKLAALEELFNQGRCTSPVMYYEAYEAYKRRPELVWEITPFAVQVLNFAVKRKLADYAVCVRFADAVNASDTGRILKAGKELILKILEDAYDNYPVSQINTALARLLILNGRRRKDSHKYFDRALFDGADIPGLYNFYVFSIDPETMPPLPEHVLRYFSQDAASLLDKRTYFYANIVKNRYANSAYQAAYMACLSRMQSFAYGQALAGRNDEFLSVIYSDIFKKDTRKELEDALLKVMTVRRLTCTNQSFNWVLVFHEELSVYQEVILEPSEDGSRSAYINIYGSRYQILFKDAAGNLYKNIEYSLKEFPLPEIAAGTLIKDLPVNTLMLTGENLKKTWELKNPEEILDYILENAPKSTFTKEYENELAVRIVRFYREESIPDELYKKFLKLLDDETGEELSALVIEVIIKKKHYNEALEKTEKYGYEMTDPDILCSFTHTMVQLEGDSKKELLCAMCRKCVDKGCMDREILRYLCRYSDGSAEDLLYIYEKSSLSGVYNLNVAERILEKAMEEDARPDVLALIFARVYEESRDTELIHDYLEYSCARYIYAEKPEDSSFFEYFGKELLWERSFSDRANLAYLVFMSKKEKIPSNLLKKIQTMLCGYVYKGVMLEEFKEYGRFFKIPGVLANSHIACVIRRGAEQPVYAEYEISSPEKIRTGTVKMTEVFPGCFISCFTLFYNETLKYTISITNGMSVSLGYADIKPADDGSRYSDVNRISGLCRPGEEGELKEALKEYYLKDKLIGKLF